MISSDLMQVQAIYRVITSIFWSNTKSIRFAFVMVLLGYFRVTCLHSSMPLKIVGQLHIARLVWFCHMSTGKIKAIEKF